MMAKRVLTLRGVSLAMLKNAWRGDLRRLLALNRDIMLRSLLLQLCFGALTVYGARLGSDIVAVNAVLMTMLTFTAYALDGFAYAVEAHSGQAYGARDGSQLLEVWRAACRQSGMVALAFALIYSLAGGVHHRVVNLAAFSAAAGRSLSDLAGHPAGGGRLVLSAGRHVYRRHTRRGDAEQHGGRRGGVCCNAAFGPAAR